jgi:hypothetical protein
VIDKLLSRYERPGEQAYMMKPVPLSKADEESFLRAFEEVFKALGIPKQ